METTRQQKVSKQIQRDIAEILQRDMTQELRGVLTTVTVVRISPDLSYAKVYISIFPFERGEEVLKIIKENNWKIRHALGTRVKNQLRIVPELEFFIDDSLEYIENIDRALK